MLETPPAPQTAAFTLVELLTCLAIAAVLAAILLAALAGVRASSQRTRCIANLRQIGVAAGAYAADNKGLSAPPAFLQGLADYLPRQVVGSASPWLCPADAREKTAGPDLSYSDPSYAYNAQRIGLPPTYWATSSLRVGTIAKPATTVYFSDARAYYMNKVPANQNAEFRHGGAINALFFDGHVQTLRFDAVADFYELL